MNKRKLIISILTICIILLSGTASAFFSKFEINNHFQSSDRNNAKWTVMYYMCGDDPGMDAYISPLLENLSKIGSSEDINIVALKDNLGEDNSNLYFIDESGSLIELSWPDEVDMSDLHVLEMYCTQMMENYSAEYYALITYTPAGTGWQQFILGDKDSKKKLSTPDFGYCLKNITNKVNHKIDVLFVSCAMNTIELAYEISPYVDYIVGTQDCYTKKTIVPRFSEAVWDLKNSSDMSPEEFSKRAPYRCEPEPFYYEEGYGNELRILCKIFNMLPFKGLHTVIHYPSSSVINLSKIKELVHKIDNLLENLTINLKNIKFKEEIRRARSETQEYSKCLAKFPFLWVIFKYYSLNIFAYDCVVDLYNFIEILSYYIDNVTINNLCNSILEFYKEVIPAIKKISYDNSNGINIYFPKQRHMYNRFVFEGNIPCRYENLKFSKESLWDDFLVKFLSL